MILSCMFPAFSVRFFHYIKIPFFWQLNQRPFFPKYIRRPLLSSSHSDTPHKILCFFDRVFYAPKQSPSTCHCGITHPNGSNSAAILPPEPERRKFFSRLSRSYKDAGRIKLFDPSCIRAAGRKRFCDQRKQILQKECCKIQNCLRSAISFCFSIIKKHTAFGQYAYF